MNKFDAIKEKTKRALTGKICENCKYMGFYTSKNKLKEKQYCQYKTRLVATHNRKNNKESKKVIYTTNKKSCIKWKKKEE